VGNQGPGQTVSSRSPQFKARAAPLPSVNTSTLARSDYSILPVRSVVSPKSVITDLWCIRRGEAVFYPPAGRSLGSRRRASGAGMPPLEAMTMDGASTSTATLPAHIASHNKIGDALGSLRPSPPRPRAPAHLDPYCSPRLSPGIAKWTDPVPRSTAVGRPWSPVVRAS
jgi:hypothetical protein